MQSADDMSIEIPLSEIRRIALGMGFRLEREEQVDTGWYEDGCVLTCGRVPVQFWR